MSVHGSICLCHYWGKLPIKKITWKRNYKRYRKRKMYNMVCSETVGTAHREEVHASSLGKVLVKACLCISMVCSAAAIQQRTADTAAPGSYSSRHTGSLPGQCVRPPSGQREAQTCTGHPPGPHTASLHQPCTSHQTLKTSVFPIPSYKLGWKRLMNLHQDFTVKHRTPLRVSALFDFLFWVASILSSCQLCSLLLVSWLTPTFSVALKLCLCFLFASFVWGEMF